MKTPRSVDEVRDWLITKLTHQMGIKPQHLNLDDPIEDQGLDSMQFIKLVGELEEWLGLEFDENPLLQSPSINALAKRLGESAESFE